MDLDIIPADSIDYSNVDEVCGYQLLLYTMYERAGGFDYPSVVNATIIKVCNEGVVWLGNVKMLIDSILDAPSSPRVPTYTPSTAKASNSPNTNRHDQDSFVRRSLVG